MIIKTTDIINKIQSDFSNVYKPFGKLQQEPIYKELLDTVKDPDKMNYIITSNNLFKEPPTKTFLILNPHIKIQSVSQFSAKDINKAIGAFWGFVFKSIFGYRKTEHNVTINTKGVDKASYFYDSDDIIQVIP